MIEDKIYGFPECIERLILLKEYRLDFIPEKVTVMKKIKILHILNTGSYSGAENAVITIIKKTEKFVNSTYLSIDGSIRGILDESGIEFYSVKSLNVISLKRAVYKIKPDIIHAHDFTAGVVSVLAIAKIPIINHLHSNSPWLKTVSLRTVIYGISCLRYKRILTVSDSVIEEYIFKNFIKPKAIVVGNPFDMKMVQEKARYVEMESSFDVIFLGRYSFSKNPIMFIEIIKSLSAIFPDVRAVMIGDGEMRYKIELYIRELELSKHIIVYGFEKNPYVFLNASRILCMPSRWEGFGFSAVEALALGKPVLASPVGGLKDIVTVECGKLCATKEAFVMELQQLLTNSDYYQLKSNGAYVRAAKFDNVSEYIDRLKEIYQSIALK